MGLFLFGSNLGGFISSIVQNGKNLCAQKALKWLFRSGLASCSFLFFGTTFIQASQPLSLEGYVAKYLKQNKSLRGEKLRLSQTESQMLRFNDQWAGNLNASLNQSQVKDQALMPSWDKQKNLSATYQQNLPTGTGLSVSAQKQLENKPFQPPRSRYNEVDHSYSLRLDQDILQNSFGQRQRMQKKLGQSRLNGAELNFLIAQARECNQAVNLFLNTYQSQEAVEIYEGTHKLSKKLFSQTKSSFRRRLIQKIDIITAENDFLNSEQRLSNSRNLLESNMSLLFNGINEKLKGTIVLKKVNPSKIMQESFANKKVSPLFFEAFQSQVKADKLQHEITKDEIKADLKVFAQYGKNINQFTTPGFADDQQSIEMGITYTLPVNNKTNLSRRRESYYQWKSRENQVELEMNQLENEWSYKVEQFEFIKRQLGSLSRQKEILRKQTKEALRLMKTGNINFREYIQFRDLELNNNLNWYRLLSELYSVTVRLQVLSNPKVNFCKQVSV